MRQIFIKGRMFQAEERFIDSFIGAQESHTRAERGFNLKSGMR